MNPQNGLNEEPSERDHSDGIDYDYSREKSAAHSSDFLDSRIAAFLGRVLDDDGEPKGTCFQVKKGLVVTAAHVLNSVSAGEIGARLSIDPLQGGAKLTALVKAIDWRSDLAVVRIEGQLALPDSITKLLPTDGIHLSTPVEITGVVEVNDAVEYKFLDAPGVWSGDTTRGGVPMGRASAKDVQRGMSGSPVLVNSPNTASGSVAGVVSGRFNSEDGWLRDSIWISRTEDLVLLLHGSGESQSHAGQSSDQPDRASEAAWLEKALLANCTAWPMEEFNADEATVHNALSKTSGYDPSARQVDLVEPPPYLPRVYDAQLRSDIVASARGELESLILLIGGSSTGKTRSLFEAIQALCQGWVVVRPRDANAARLLPKAGLWDRPCVVWLNEVQDFLAPSGLGLTRDSLRDLYRTATAPVVVVGTIWPERLDEHTQARDEETRDARDLLSSDTRWVRKIRVSDDLTDAEWEAASKIAHLDTRFSEALSDPDGYGFVQTLAGAGEVLRHYESCESSLAGSIMKAASDVSRLGLSGPVYGHTLNDIALGLWRERRGQRSPGRDWFARALEQATRPLRSEDGVRALIPFDDLESSSDNASNCTYRLADYLEQHLRRARTFVPIPDSTWDVLAHRVQGAAQIGVLARAAKMRGRFDQAERLFRSSEDPDLLVELGEWLRDRRRWTEAELVFREAAALNNPNALTQVAATLMWGPFRSADAEQACWLAAAAGQPNMLGQLADELWEVPGREDDAETAARYAGAAGLPDSLWKLATRLWQAGRNADAEDVCGEAAAGGYWYARQVLTERLWSEGREAEAERVCWNAAAAGDGAAVDALIERLSAHGENAAAEQICWDGAAVGLPHPLVELAARLWDTPGRQTEAVEAFRTAGAAGEASSYTQLAMRLWDIPGRQTEAAEAFRTAGAAGEASSYTQLAMRLWDIPGRQTEAAEAFRDSAAAGEWSALWELSLRLLDAPEWEIEARRIAREAAASTERGWISWVLRIFMGNGRLSFAEQAFRDAAANGDSSLLVELGEGLWDIAEEVAAEGAFRDAAMAGNQSALRQLAIRLWDSSGRQSNAEEAFRDAFKAGDSSSLIYLGERLLQIGREEAAEMAFRDAISADERLGSVALAELLRARPDRRSEAEKILQDSAETGNTYALAELSIHLWDIPGRELDAERAGRKAVIAGEPTALHRFVKCLRKAGRRSEAEQIEKFGLDAYGRTKKVPAGTPNMVDSEDNFEDSWSSKSQIKGSRRWGW